MVIKGKKHVYKKGAARGFSGAKGFLMSRSLLTLLNDLPSRERTVERSKGLKGSVRKLRGRRIFQLITSH